MENKLLQKADMLYLEKELQKKGINNIAGVDEAGRGPLAGDVYAAAVILPKGLYIEGINDSKKLSEKKREALFDIICKKAVSYCISSVTAAEIDKINILQATMKAMRAAISGLKIKPDYVLIDGNRMEGLDIKYQTVVGGDSKSATIAAASILAKVSRDRYMKKMAEAYPNYLFEKHKAYPTKLHLELIKKFGPCAIHRKTFKGVKEYINLSQDKPVKGRFGEEAAKQHLIKCGYKIIEQNYRCRYGEIDIVARDNDYLVFVEVKARSSSYFGLPCEAVNYNKRAKIIMCAQNYISQNNIDCAVRFDVVEIMLKNKENLEACGINLIKNAFAEV